MNTKHAIRTAGTSRTSILLAVSSIWLLSGCTAPVVTDGGLVCGEGTVEVEGVCIVDGSMGSGGMASSSSSSSSSSSTGIASSSSSSSGTGGMGGGGTGGMGSSSSGAGGSPICTDEICDGLDNDCDGDVDEDLGTVSCGIGQCAVTVQACVNGQAATCSSDAPSVEACDGLDNDCNGEVDDLGTVSCGIGQCAVTVQACVNGQAAICSPGAPAVEACDGLDNDCNGTMDDGCILDKVSYQTAPGYFDAVLDTERHQVFLSYGGSGNVHVISLASGADTVVTTGWKAEHMQFDPIRDEVVISLPTAAHSSYWWDEDQEGYVANINAVSLANPTPIWIPIDPWQIASDGSGKVFVAGGSGQWTSAATIDLNTHWSDLSGGSVRQGTNIRIHPSLNKIYGADNGLSPSDIERWNIIGGKVVPSYDSPYHGTYSMCGDLRIHPAGNTIYTKCGHIFLASNVQGTDMTWVANMNLVWQDLAFHPSGSTVYAITGNAPTIYQYDANTLQPASTYAMASTAQRILAGPSYLVLLRNILGGNPKTQIDVIPYSDL